MLSDGARIKYWSTALRASKEFRLLGSHLMAIGRHSAGLERVWSEFGVIGVPRRSLLAHENSVMMPQIKYGVRQTDAAKLMSRSVHKSATVSGSSISGKCLSSRGVQHEGFVEMEEMVMKVLIFLLMMT
jgi:hypothetical protein